ncbi:hypothetical protein Bphy_0243 [Paraburkholderia phymatum STM815]|uniref:Uncharacterized protein n=1 Tax=Paraburkholderia phymatum (strain DSM 17167 / CIP 108236 / LMG 21445 / STM815) TaxID=391038 RepID=B2JC72_PARP8|nr:hypothetical protein Bphy_0243 [Paraburkholderia phymatum STM815]
MDQEPRHTIHRFRQVPLNSNRGVTFTLRNLIARSVRALRQTRTPICDPAISIQEFAPAAPLYLTHMETCLTTVRSQIASVGLGDKLTALGEMSVPIMLIESAGMAISRPLNLF